MEPLIDALRGFDKDRGFSGKGSLCVALVVTQHVGDVAIHVTTAPGEAIIGRCRDNIDDGCRPVIVTTARGLAAAEVLAENAGLGDRIDMFEVEQFIALNLYELGKFAADGRRVAVADVVTRYNDIVEDAETDPSLRIEFRQ